MTEAGKSQMVRHSFVLIVLSNAANALSVVFQALMGRGLPSSEFTEMATMLNLMLVLTTPLDAIRTSLAHGAATGLSEGRPWTARDVVLRWSRVAAIVAAMILSAGWLLAPWLQSFFHLGSLWPARLAALMLAFMLFSPLLVGTFQGVQFFYWMASAMGLWSLVRVVSGSLLVYVLEWRAASAAVLSHALGVGVGLAISAWGVRALARRPAGRAAEHPAMGTYFASSLLMLSCYAVLMNIDMLLVKHYFPGVDADRFAQAALIGRSVVFLPVPVAYVLFPKVVAAAGSPARALRMLFQALGIAMSIIGLAVLAGTVMTWLPLLILFGIKNPAPEQLVLVRQVLWAMAPLSLTYMLINFEMAQRRFGALPFMIACVAAYVGGVALFHDSLGRFVGIMGGVSTASAIALTFLVVRNQLKAARANAAA